MKIPSDIGANTLWRMKLMKNNNRWVFEQIRPYLGNSILEVGSGIGNISQLLALSNKRLFLTDIKKQYLDCLKQKFTNNHRIKVLCCNIVSPNFSKILPLKIDTVVCINVLEHIRDDNRAIKSIHKILSENGRLILIVPALKFLYGSLDRELNHFRRYEETKLIKQLELQDFRIEKVYYHNIFSTFGWFLAGRILKQRIMAAPQVTLLDKFIPLFATIERWMTIPFGLSLVVIARKR